MCILCYIIRVYCTGLICLVSVLTRAPLCIYRNPRTRKHYIHDAIVHGHHLTQRHTNTTTPHSVLLDSCLLHTYTHTPRTSADDVDDVDWIESDRCSVSETPSTRIANRILTTLYYLTIMPVTYEPQAKLHDDFPILYIHTTDTGDFKPVNSPHAFGVL